MDIVEAVRCIFIWQFPSVSGALEWVKSPECSERTEYYDAPSIIIDQNKYSHTKWRNELAIYPIIHKETGETKVIEMSVHDITEWYQNNPEWKRDWPSGCASSVELGEVYDRLKKTKPGWNEVLTRASKVPGSRVKPI